ncbi:ABC transporter permease [Paenibacillus faecalis]|uniref:ABC transporter permease n=1 Tax=Paenibacillus faecalis TaxID=2079532 RepID=UPI000D114131|nr:ABC transporter permease subunit [Paenibacillus faecalis]
MTDFFKLIANENMKIYGRVRTWVMLGILAAFNVLMPVLLNLTGAQIDVWTAFSWTESITFMLNVLFTVVIAADIVAGEFTWGTIKLLMIRPWGRGKILLSKFVAMLLFSLFGTIIVASIGILSSALLFSEPSAFISGSGGARSSMLLLLTDYVELFVIALIAFMISTVFRSSNLAISLSMILLVTKDIFTLLFNPEKHEWQKYILFLHLDLSDYIHSSVGPGGVGIGFSIAVLIGYCFVFAFVSWWVFSKRDIAA